jgi:predicted Na+-dependent transporter
MRWTWLADRVAEALLPLALVAVGLALLLPSDEAAARGDLVLAVLVALTALGIAPRELSALHNRWKAVLALSLAPFAVLVPLAWAISRLFDSPVREGVLTLGLSSTEVAAVGLVALAGGDAALALGALAGSLVAAATIGPLLVGLLASDAAGADAGELLGRFALVVLVPLAAGVAARVVRPRLARGEPWFAAGSTLAVVVLIYASLSGTSAGEDLLPALAASAAFLGLSALPALGWARLVAGEQRAAVGFAVGLRDFAVGATLATQAFGSPAAAVGGIYGVLMLIAGALATAMLRRHNGDPRPTASLPTTWPERALRGPAPRPKAGDRSHRA